MLGDVCIVLGKRGSEMCNVCTFTVKGLEIRTCMYN